MFLLFFYCRQAKNSISFNSILNLFRFYTGTHFFLAFYHQYSSSLLIKVNDSHPNEISKFSISFPHAGSIFERRLILGFPNFHIAVLYYFCKINRSTVTVIVVIRFFLRWISYYILQSRSEVHQYLNKFFFFFFFVLFTRRI